MTPDLAPQPNVLPWHNTMLSPLYHAYSHYNINDFIFLSHSFSYIGPGRLAILFLFLSFLFLETVSHFLLFQYLTAVRYSQLATMTRGMNMGKPRAPHPKDAITTPVLHYTSAVQRNDLYSHAVSTNHTQSSNEAMSLWDFQRPRTSEARARNKKHPNLRIKIPPRDAVSTPIQTDGTNGNTIGIALGSPRMIDRRNGIPQLRQQDPFAAPAEKSNRAPAIQRKPSKWRKIGGLFKAKNTMNPTASRPSYKVRNNNPPPGSSHSIDSQSHAEAGREPNSLSPGDDEKGNCFGGIRNFLEAKRKLKIDSKPQSKTAAGQGAPEPKGPDTVPFLEVDIPDTHLERYSVMFGGLFGQGKPALLARRSKTMDGMVSLNKEVCPIYMKTVSQC